MTSPDDLMQHGIERAGAGDVAGARAAFERIAAGDDPAAAATARLNLGVLLAGADDLPGATAAFAAAAASGDPDVAPRALVRGGSCLVRAGDLDGAVRLWHRAVASGHPVAAAESLLLYGLLRTYTGPEEQVLAAWWEVTRTAGPDQAAEAWTRLIDWFGRRSDGARAAAATDAPDVCRELGVRLDEAGYGDRAERWLERAASLGDVTARTSLGVVRFRAGRYDAAADTFREAADAGDPVAARNLGRMLIGWQRGPGVVAEGVGWLRTAIERADVPAGYFLGAHLLTTGEVDAGWALIEQAAAQGMAEATAAVAARDACG